MKSTDPRNKGYYFHKARGKWRVRIRVNGEQMDVGSYKTEKEAKLAYAAAMKENFR